MCKVSSFFFRNDFSCWCILPSLHPCILFRVLPLVLFYLYVISIISLTFLLFQLTLQLPVQQSESIWDRWYDLCIRFFCFPLFLFGPWTLWLVYRPCMYHSIQEFRPWIGRCMFKRKWTTIYSSMVQSLFTLSCIDVWRKNINTFSFEST